MATLSDRGRVRSMRYDHARRCELGGQVRCFCRCRGEFHGAQRINFSVDPIGLSRLALTDPHYVPLARHPQSAARLPLFEESPHA